jgi:plasmid maintenance system antidote protein VapI
MDKVKKLVAAGASIPTAIKASLGMTVADFAEKHGIARSSASNHISGQVKATDDTIAALIAELGGTVEEWRELLWLAAKPDHVEPVRATA